MSRQQRALAAGWALAGLLIVAFTAAAAVRRLNFDECLALRSGFLLVHGIPASPPFAMPVTALLGGLSAWLPEPAHVFLAGRLLVVLTVLGTGLWALRAAAVPRGEALAAAALTLGNAAFVAHGLELRYDWALLLGLLASFGLLTRARDGDVAALGVTIAWLSCHHVKGLALAVAVYALGLGRSGRSAPRLLRLHLGLALGLGAWFAAAGLLGAEGPVEVHTFFFRLAARAQGHEYGMLFEALRRDGAFWLAAAFSAAVLIPSARRDPATLSADAPAATAAALGLAALALPFAHPTPWPYMLALPAPFAALLVARAAARTWRDRPRSVVAIGLLLAALQAVWTSRSVVSVYRESWSASRRPQERVLEILATLRREGDLVLDPSGLAYFLPPCAKEWYVDGLFEPEAAAGRWMRDQAWRNEPGCRWLVKSHRLDMLPEPARRWAGDQFTVAPGGLGLRRDDPRLPALLELSRVGPHEPAGRFRVQSFW